MGERSSPSRIKVELFTESILSTVRSHYSDALLELTKRLGCIQDVTVLKEIGQAALVSDIQGVWSLVRASDPAR